jgi:hypothetical protein
MITLDRGNLQLQKWEKIRTCNIVCGHLRTFWILFKGFLHLIEDVNTWCRTLTYLIEDANSSVISVTCDYEAAKSIWRTEGRATPLRYPALVQPGDTTHTPLSQSYLPIKMSGAQYWIQGGIFTILTRISCHLHHSPSRHHPPSCSLWHQIHCI